MPGESARICLAMNSAEAIKARLAEGCPGAQVELVTNPAPSAQHSLLIESSRLVEVARFLRDAPDLRFDYCSNVTGIDWLDRSAKVKVKKVENGTEQEVEETRVTPGYLEVVYHLYSMAHKHGPTVLRARTRDRLTNVRLPSLTPVWRSCELQEREVYDLFGIIFDGHPDLRRLLMWDGFKDHPMRKDYTEPDDYEYEPTAHDHVLDRARKHQEDASK